MDMFQFPPQDPGQVGRLVPHGTLVDRIEFIEGLHCQGFREILDHTKNSLVERAVDLAAVLDVIDHLLDVDWELVNRSGGPPGFSALAIPPVWLRLVLLRAWLVVGTASHVSLMWLLLLLHG